MITGKKLFEFYILWSTNKCSKCGYDIRKELDELFERKRLSNALLYISLRRLESLGHLTGKKGPRNKTVYTITEKGRARLDVDKREFKKHVLRFKDVIDEILEMDGDGEK